MAFLAWSQRYSVNVRSCDEEHKHLFAMVNELHDAMCSGRGDETVKKLVFSLTEYVKNHFCDEEFLMSKSGYPGLAAHKAEHQSFSTKLNGFKKTLFDGGQVNTVTFVAFLKTWLTQHVLGTDRAYSSHLNDNGIR